MAKTTRHRPKKRATEPKLVVCDVAKITQHHLVWTRREWTDSILRHNPYAKIRLTKKAHTDFHTEHEPFMCFTPVTMRRFELLARRAVIMCPRDVLETMIKVCECLLAGPPVPRRDVRALECNIQKARAQLVWLDARVPHWNSRRAKRCVKLRAVR